MKSQIEKDRNREKILQLEITEVALLHVIIVNKQNLHDSRVLCIYILNQLFHQPLNISITNCIYSNTFHSK